MPLRVSVVASHSSADSALLEDELDGAAAADEERVRVLSVHTDRDEGHVTARELQAAIDAPSRGHVVLVAGPPGFWDTISAQLLAQGHAERNVVELES